MISAFLILKKNAKRMCGNILGASIVILGVLFVVSLFFPQVERFRLVYAEFFFLMLLGYFVHTKVSFTWHKIEIYLVLGLCLFFGIDLAIQYPGNKAIIFPLLFVILPILFTDNLRNMAAFLIFIVTVYIIILVMYQDPAIWFQEMYNILALLVLALFIHWSMGREQCLGYLSRAANEEMIVKLKTMKQELKHLSENDVLTGLSNRRKLFQTMGRIESEALRAPKGVMMLDIDQFKEYNDTYGHMEGDKCLQSFGRMLHRVEEQADIHFYRYGGEEFVGLFWGEQREALDQLAATVCSETHGIDLGTVPITGSIGTAWCESVGKNYEQWIARADKAVYFSKRHGRDCVHCWNNLPSEERNMQKR